MGILEQYESFFYYNELRDDNGELIMYIGSSYDTINVDDTSGLTILSNSNNEDIFMLNPNLYVISLQHIDNKRDKVILSDGNFYINIFYFIYCPHFRGLRVI